MYRFSHPVYIALLPVLLTLAVFQANADECTQQVAAYIDGLRVGMELTPNQQSSVRTREKITQIQKMRETKSDCEVLLLIQPLNDTRKALEAADASVQQRH